MTITENSLRQVRLEASDLEGLCGAICSLAGTISHSPDIETVYSKLVSCLKDLVEFEQITIYSLTQPDCSLQEMFCNSEGDSLDFEETSSQLQVPLWYQGRRVGELHIKNSKLQTYNVRQRSILEILGGQIGPVMENSPLMGETRSRSDFEAQTSSAAALSNRESQGLRLLVKGDTNSAIANTLGISTNTVKSHIRHIMGKLKTRNRIQTTLAGRKCLGLD